MPTGHAVARTGPHLHFDVVPSGCVAVGCPTAKVTFRNTSAHPHGLDVGQTYAAEPF